MSDAVDKKILNLLIQKPFITQKELAQELNVTPPAIYSRLQRMRQVGIFNGYSPIIAYDKLGYDIIAIINIKVKNGKVQEAATMLAADPNVCAVYDITGEYDTLAIAKFHNTKELDAWDNELIKKTDLIERANTSIAFNAPKDNTNTNVIE